MSYTMKHSTSAKLALGIFWIPLLLALSPFIILWGGFIYFFETFDFAIGEELRWAKYCDDYEAREKTN